MASERRWQSGVYIGDPSGYSSAPQFTKSLWRYIFEFLTQVAGWDVVDAPDAGWTAVKSSGSDGATDATLTDRFISASASFVREDVGSLLTITGIASPNEEKNGIYEITEYVSPTTVILNIKLGVHSDGLPTGLSGLNWRLWRTDSTTAYVPGYSQTAVVAGEGKTGAGLNDATGTGDSFSLAGTTITFTDAGATFQDSDVGKSMIIEGATTPGNNGTFVITSRISATQITYENASGATEAFAGTWKIRYKFHLRFTTHSTSAGDPSYLGTSAISPWPTWNSGTHAWDDNRHTAEWSMVISQPCDRIQSFRIWAVCDKNCATFYWRTERGYYGWAQSWNIFQFGEMETFYPDKDPNPVLQLQSGARYDDRYYVIGTGANWIGPRGPSGGIYMLGWDELTTCTGYLMFPHSPYSADYNWLSRMQRRRSMWSKKFYRMRLIVESRTSGFMELRGLLNHMTYMNQQQTFALEPFGATHELIHLIGGIVFPWHQGKQWYELSGRSGPVA